METQTPRETQPNAEIGQNLLSEMQEFEQFPECAETCAILITEGRFTETGRYVPGQIEGVNTEAAEFDPELSELAKELTAWIPQSQEMSCAVACQTMAVNQLERGFYTERQLLDIGETHSDPGANHPWYENGTYASDVGKIAQYMGMEVEQLHNVSAESLTLANDPEVKVIANVDHTLLSYPDSYKRCQPDHAVQVLRVEHTSQGDMVILNDPGRSNGRGAVYPMEVFEKAYRGDITTIRKGAAE